MNKIISEKLFEAEKTQIIINFEEIVYNNIINSESSIMAIGSKITIVYDAIYDEINILYINELIIKIKDHKIIFSDAAVENPINFIEDIKEEDFSEI